MSDAEEFKNLLAEAENGNAEAMAAVGMAYGQGTGTAVDGEQMLLWLRKAAAAGSVEAKESLAEMFRIWLSEAENGNIDLLNAVGAAYLQGIGTEVDYQQAVAWFKKAAARGNAAAKFQAKGALILAEVLLPSRNFKELFDGAQRGDAKFQYSLGFAYLRGYGTEVDGKQAVFWFQKAADQGHADAKQVLPQVELLIQTGAENFDTVVPINAIKRTAGKHQILYSIILMAAVSYITTGLNIGWLRSFAIIYNIFSLLCIPLGILSGIMAVIKPKRLVIFGIIFWILFIILIPIGIGTSVHYVKGRKAGNPVSIVLQNPFEAVRKQFFGASKPKEPVEIVYTLDVQSENGAAKIFNVIFGKDETVIRLIRTTGSHKAVSIASPGEANSFYVQDKESGETWPLKEMRLQDYDDASGVDLVFEPLKSRSFDLIEGKDTSKSAWHFRNVNVEGK
ncbi:sel1 repeat family protein [Treponema primitia]|uniref:tetratricopeptide repeat protein n=1 Tax=Treponema primitia TaxID=88058 RepID=UPI00397E9DF0